jgi:hypothetical protein
MIVERFKSRLVIDKTWCGCALSEDEHAHLSLHLSETQLVIDVDAPFYCDPSPDGPVGTTWALWEHEVMEIFILGEQERYLEVELGPYGHYLLLLLEGQRNIIARDLPMKFHREIEGGRWRGRSEIERKWLPKGDLKVNAYGIHGQGEERVHQACYALVGDRPDFHQLSACRPIRWTEG